MEPFVRHQGIAAPLPIDNVDTDAIIPSRETQSVSRHGYGEKLFANWRYRPGTREVNPDFVLNMPPFTSASILVSGRNFGCGSSREAAVWSLKQFGIRCVIAQGFGAIFRNNSIRNGLVPVDLPDDAIKDILSQMHQTGFQVSVDLEKCRVICGKSEYAFAIGSLDREMLLSGLDELELTLSRRDQIDAFRAHDMKSRPWVYSARWKETS